MMMNETRTTSMLLRVPAILAVTANSYGLSLQDRPARPQRLSDCHHRRSKAAVDREGARQARQ
jgi:hypothetical protein